MFVVYRLRSNDGSNWQYIGSVSEHDFERKIRQHRDGKIATTSIKDGDIVLTERVLVETKEHSLKLSRLAKKNRKLKLHELLEAAKNLPDTEFEQSWR
jgi:predicted GIY-YIG superfamily endonuclease